jgi:hypothetical protein
VILLLALATRTPLSYGGPRGVRLNQGCKIPLPSFLVKHLYSITPRLLASSELSSLPFSKTSSPPLAARICERTYLRRSRLSGA